MDKIIFTDIGDEDAALWIAELNGVVIASGRDKTKVEKRGLKI